MPVAAAILLALGAQTVSAQAADPEDEALSLPTSSAPAPPAANSGWHWFAEGMAGAVIKRDAALREHQRSLQRLSFDVQADLSPARDWRFLLADRLDLDAQQGTGQTRVNTLKDAYLSWRAGTDVLLDAGRINQYTGVALGYNPTDFFRSGSLRSQVSLDPTVIKKNRQGRVMVRGQVLRETGSTTALYAPPQAGAAGRAMLIVSQRLGEDMNPQWVLFKEGGEPLQAGLNLTRLLNDATVAYLEWSGGRSLSQLAQALQWQEAAVFRNRLALGLTHTGSNKLSLSLEYQYNGAALNQAQWEALARTSLPAYIHYRLHTQSALELPTRQSLFVYASKQDWLLNHLNLSAMLRHNLEDRSRLHWLELRYVWPGDEIALQWQGKNGNLFSEYGAADLRRGWQISYRRFF